MYAMIGVLIRPPGMDRATFRSWWLDEHAHQAKELPGLRRYQIFPAKHGFDSLTGDFTDQPSHEGVAFLWFDDEAACRRAFGSAIGHKDREHFNESPMKAIVFCSAEQIEIPL